MSIETNSAYGRCFLRGDIAGEVRVFGVVGSDVDPEPDMVSAENRKEKNQCHGSYSVRDKIQLLFEDFSKTFEWNIIIL